MTNYSDDELNTIHRAGALKIPLADVIRLIDYFRTHGQGGTELVLVKRRKARADKGRPRKVKSKKATRVNHAEHVLAAISEAGKAGIGPKAIAAKTGMGVHAVRVWLASKRRRGWYHRVSPGVYASGKA